MWSKWPWVKLHTARGRIVWGEELQPDQAYEFGVKFVGIDDKVRDDLRAFVGSRAAPS